MITSILGRKVGMTQIFDAVGNMVPVTVVEAGPCVISQVKTAQSDGYEALQLAFSDKKAKHTTKPLLGHFGKSGSTPKAFVREVPSDGEPHEAGDKVTVEIFADVHHIDVTGTSKGKGFAGVVKRWHFAGQPATHGAMGLRVPGSIGQSAYPSRVLKGTRMGGHMGDARVTIRGQELVRIDAERNLLFIKGQVPGADGGFVMVTKSPEWVAKRKKQTFTTQAS